MENKEVSERASEKSWPSSEFSCVPQATVSLVDTRSCSLRRAILGRRHPSSPHRSRDLGVGRRGSRCGSAQGGRVGRERRRTAPSDPVRSSSGPTSSDRASAATATASSEGSVRERNGGDSRCVSLILYASWSPYTFRWSLAPSAAAGVAVSGVEARWGVDRGGGRWRDGFGGRMERVGGLSSV